MVIEFWKTNPPGFGGTTSCGFISKLTNPKKLSKNWAHHKTLQDDHLLKQIENELEVFEKEQGGLYRFEEHKNHITSLY